MDSFGTVNRRLHARRRDHIYSQVIFDLNGQRLEATLIDLSPTGARFMSFENIDSEHLEKRNIEYIIETSLGPSVCTGCTRWVRRRMSETVWGVRFLILSISPEDPLRKMINALEVEPEEHQDYMM